jgi:hypothetical protein
MSNFTSQLHDYKYNPKSVASDRYNTKLTVLKFFSKSIARELFCADFPVYIVEGNAENQRKMVRNISELNEHNGRFCTDKKFSNIIGSENSKDGLVGRIDITIREDRKDKQQVLLYFDLESFLRDIRKARDLAVPIKVQYFDLYA